MAVDQHEAMTRACLKDVFNRRDLSSLDKYMSAGEFFPNWPAALGVAYKPRANF
jgi:hypothetical protein